MWNARRFASALALVTVVALGATACAPGPYGYPGRYEPRRDIGRVAYDNGFRNGVQQGERDARRGRSFAYERDRDYRGADNGYRREFGPREEYRRVFRDGYRAGYAEGYNRYARGRGDRRR